MSWFVRLAPVVMMCACGGTIITREEDAGAGGKVGTGGDIGDGGDVGSGGTIGAGGKTRGGDTVNTGAVVGSGGHIATGGVAGSGGTMATGGVAGSGGTMATGGIAGSGGTAGNGGYMGGTPMKHRSTAVACGVPPEVDAAAPQGPSPAPETCMTSADCTSGPNGRCITGRVGLHCTYDQCFNDSDCGKGSVCACSTAMSEGSRCLGQGCQVDADCPAGFCSPTFGACGDYGGVVSYQCHSIYDGCLDDYQCTTPPPGYGSGTGYCAYDPNLGHWACSYTRCAG